MATAPRTAPQTATQRGTTMHARWWAVSLLLAAFALRVHALDAKSLWYDELRQVEVAQQPLESLTPFLLLHAGRPLDYLVTHALLQSGGQEFWLRTPALLWSTLAAAVLYALARRWFQARTALWALALFAASPFAVQYAQELRPYALYLLLSLLAFYTLERALAPAAPRWAWLALAVIAAAGSLTHFFYAFVLSAQGLYCLLGLAWPPRRPRWRRSLAGLAAAGLAGFAALWVAAKPEHLLLFARRFLVALGVAASGGALIAETGIPLRVNAAVNLDFFLKGLLPALGAGPGLAALLLYNGLALLGLAALAARQRRRLVLVVLWLAVTPALVVVYLQFRQQFFALRYVLFALPGYLLLVAHGLDVVTGHRAKEARRGTQDIETPAWIGWLRRAAPMAVLAVLLGFGLNGIRLEYLTPKDDWRRVGAFLTANVRPGDTLGAPDVQAFIRFYAPDQPAAIVDTSARGPHEQALANGERFWFVWSDYTLLPVDDTRAWVNSLSSVTIQLDPRIKVIFVHPGRTQAEMLEEAEGFVIPAPSLR